jgi:hypothetical protein
LHADIPVVGKRLQSCWSEKVDVERKDPGVIDTIPPGRL